MNRPRKNVLRLGVGLVLLLAWSACQPEKKSSGEWRVYAGDVTSNKYSRLHQITRDNAKTLTEAWTWTSPDNAIVDQVNQDGLKLWPHAYETTPLMVGGVLYASTSLSQVAAIDAATGQTLWVYDPKTYYAADGKTLAYPPNQGFVERGVAYWEDGWDRRIFFGTGDAQLLALDTNGHPIPDFGTGGRVDLKAGLRRPVTADVYSVTSPPIVCGDTVVVGSCVVDFPVDPELPPGDVRGFDARTGKLLWTFHTVPQAGDPGTATWKNDSWKTIGAANVWAPMSCDPELGNIYLPTSTPANDFYGGRRQGDGLYGESIVAVNAKTGQRVWHYQVTHHGLWDYDLPAAPTLVDIKVDGRPIKALAQPTKQGMVFVLDRVTGLPVWPIEERPVPPSKVPGEQASPTQPFPTKPAPIDRQGLTDDDLIDFTPELRQQALDLVHQYEYGPIYTPPSIDNSANGGKKGTIALPGDIGGSSWTGATFDPEKGVLYVPSVTLPAVYALTGPFPAAEYAGISGPIALPNGLPISKPPYGRMTAIDLNTGNHLWQATMGRGPIDHPALKDLHLPRLGWPRRSFVLATGDLLFVTQEGIVKPRPQLSPYTSFYELTNSESYLWTYDPSDGTMLSETPIPEGNAAGSPITYMANGRQFVVIPVGGAGNPAKLVAFALPENR